MACFNGVLSVSIVTFSVIKILNKLGHETDPCRICLYIAYI